MAGGILGRRGSSRAITIIIAVASLSALVVPALSAPGKKQYDASVVPASGQGGQETQLSIKITNQTYSQVAGSANVTLPAGFTNIGQPSVVGVFDASGNPVAKTWSATTSGNVIQLRNPGPSSTNALTQGQNVRVSVTAILPCAPTTYTIGVDVKQSNDFNGSGNDLSGPDVAFTVTSGCAHHLAFTTNPPATGTLAGQPMSSVTVQVQDAANNPVDVDGLGVTVCISDGSGGCSAQTLYGTTSGTTTDGSVTFSGLIIAQDTPDQTYRLLAQAATDPPGDALSSQFTVAGTAVACTGGPCNANFGDTENPARGHFSGALFTNGTECSDCFLTIAASPLAPEDCPGDYQCRAGVTFLYIPPENAEGTSKLLVSGDKKDFPGTGVANFRLWLEKPTIGAVELFPCGSPVVTPCIEKRNRTGVGDIQWVVLVDNDDPRPLG